MRIKAMVVFAALLASWYSTLRAGPSTDKIRVIVSKANIYFKPNAESLVIFQVRAGAVLVGEKYDGMWFKTALPPDKDGFVAIGFLRAQDIEVFFEDKPVLKGDDSAPPKPDESKPVRLPAAAVNPIAFKEQKTDETKKRELFDSAKKSQLIAVLLSFLPSAGHAYTGNWGKGLGFAAARASFGILTMLAGYRTTMSGSVYERNYSFKSEKTVFFSIGIVGTAVLTIWEMAHASKLVEEYNQSAYDGIYGVNLNIGVRLAPQRAAIQLAFYF